MGDYFNQSRDVVNQQGNANGTIKGLYRPFYYSVDLREIVVANRKFTQNTYSYRSGILYDDQALTPGSILRGNLEKNLTTSYDTGHNFRTVKGSAKSSHSHYSVVGQSGAQRYLGPLTFNTIGTPNAERVWSFSEPNLQRGTHAIAQTKPTKSIAHITRFLLELVIDVPKIPGSMYKFNTKSSLKKLPGLVSDDYLNAMFGLVPSVSDVLQICQAIVKSEDLVAQFLRDSGQIVRRNFEFPIERNESIVSLAPGEPLGSPFDNPGNSMGQDVFDHDYEGYGLITRTVKSTEKYSWVGAYTYYLGEDDSALGKIRSAAQLARIILGIEGLTPELLWELAPWSWLSDWFVDIGDIISNGTSFNRDNLVLKYNYLMRETHIEDKYVHSGVRFHTGPTGPITYTEFFTEKRRVKGTPYGFGLTPGGFSNQQWAILAALGFTNGNRSLL